MFTGRRVFLPGFPLKQGILGKKKPRARRGFLRMRMILIRTDYQVVLVAGVPIIGVLVICLGR